MSENNKSLKKAFRNAKRHLANAIAPGTVLPFNNSGIDNDVINYIAFSSRGRELLRYACDNEVRLNSEYAIGIGGFYTAHSDEFDKETKEIKKVKLISLNSFTSKSQKISSLAHELCHAFQDRDGILANKVSYNLDFRSKFVTTMAQEAGANAETGVMAYNLAQKGKDKMWNAYQKQNPHFAKNLLDSIKDNDNKYDENKAFGAIFKGFYDEKCSTKKMYVDGIREELLAKLEKEQSYDLEQEKLSGDFKPEYKPYHSQPVADVAKYCATYNGKSCLSSPDELEGFEMMAVPLDLLSLAKQVNQLECKHGGFEDKSTEGMPIVGAYESYVCNQSLKRYRQQGR